MRKLTLAVQQARPTSKAEHTKIAVEILIAPAMENR
jgi:hypothetical protein